MAVRHDLYVVRGRDLGAKPRRLTLHILRYVLKNLPHLRKMNVTVAVHGVTLKALRAPRLAAFLKAKRVSSFPALVTTRNTYTGNRAIAGLYDAEIGKYKTWNAKTLNGDGGGDDLGASMDEYYRAEMTMDKAKAEKDDEVETASESITDFSKKIESFQRRREALAPPAPGDAKTPAGRPGNVAPQPAPPRGGPAPDNVTPGTRPITDLDDDGGDEDDLMYRTMLGNLESTY